MKRKEKKKDWKKERPTEKKKSISKNTVRLLFQLEVLLR